MKLYSYSEARQNFSTVLNTAVKEEVIITRRDGSRFKVIPLTEKEMLKKSPFENVKGIEAQVTMSDILSAIREGRERP